MEPGIQASVGCEHKLMPDEALHRDADDSFEYPVERIHSSIGEFLAHPELAPLSGQLDCVVSASGLNWVGDIVGASLLMLIAPGDIS